MLLLQQRLLSKCQSVLAQQFVRAGVSNAVWMPGKCCEAAACRVVVARGGNAQQTMGREVTAASLAGSRLGAGWALGWLSGGGGRS